MLIVTKPIEVFQCLKLVRFFDVGKLEHVKNPWNFETRIWSHFIKPYQLFFTVWFDKSWSIDINIRMKTWFNASLIPLSDLIHTWEIRKNGHTKNVLYYQCILCIDTYIYNYSRVRGMYLRREMNQLLMNLDQDIVWK